MPRECLVLWAALLWARVFCWVPSMPSVALPKVALPRTRLSFSWIFSLTIVAIYTMLIAL